MTKKKNKTKDLGKMKKPRLHWYKGKLIEKISDDDKDDPKKIRKKWKNDINREY